MKVATIILAIAVASVSAKNPADAPIDFQNTQPAVRANAAEAGAHLKDGALYTAQAVGDAARELQANIIKPSADVVEGGVGGAAHKTAGFVDSAIGNLWGTASAFNKKGGQAGDALARFFHSTAQKQSRKYDEWHNVKAHHDEAAADRFEQASQPLRAGAENVKSVASDARDKAAELKDSAADKLHASKEKAEHKAEAAKDATVEGTRATGNKAAGAFASMKAGLASVTQRFGENVEKAGAKVADKSEEVKERNAEIADARYARADGQIQNVNLQTEEIKSGASALTMSGAAIAVASAAAVYLF